MTFPCCVKDRFTHTMPLPCCVKDRFTHTVPFPCRFHAVLKTDSHIPCRSPATTLPFSDSAVSFVKVRMVDHAVILPRPCHEPAVKGLLVAWQGNSMVCVNQTRPHCVNQMGKTQSKPLEGRHGRGTAWYV